MAFRLTSLDHLVLTVKSIDASVEFYQAIGMEPRSFDAGTERRWALHFGRQKINLHAADAPFKPNAAKATPGSADLCFLTDTPISEWIEYLKECEIKVHEGPVARTGAQGDLTSIYVRDPDGNLIEISNLE